MAVRGETSAIQNQPAITRVNLRQFPWWLLIILAAVAYMTFRIATDTTYQNIFNIILRGLQITVYVTIVSFVLSLVIGLLAGLGRISRNGIIRNVAIAYIEFIRGVPILVLIFTIALVIVPAIVSTLGLNRDTISPTSRAIAALALIYGAYLAEIFRAGIESIGRGQMEAARSLGMSHTQAMRFIILPQAFRNVLPAVGNDFIAILKDSSLVSVLGVRDLTQVSRLHASSSFQYNETFFTLTFFYLAMTLVLSLFLQWLQRRISTKV